MFCVYADVMKRESRGRERASRDGHRPLPPGREFCSGDFLMCAQVCGSPLQELLLGAARNATVGTALSAGNQRGGEAKKKSKKKIRLYLQDDGGIAAGGGRRGGNWAAVPVVN